MAYLTRQLICQRLRLGRRQSYRIVFPSYGPLINDSEVVHLLNDARRSIPEPFTMLPSDLMTPEELAADPELNGAISAHRLLVWTRRRKNIPPHFRLTTHTIRFSRSLFFNWLSRRSRIKRNY